MRPLTRCVAALIPLTFVVSCETNLAPTRSVDSTSSSYASPPGTRARYPLSESFELDPGQTKSFRVDATTRPSRVGLFGPTVTHEGCYIDFRSDHPVTLGLSPWNGKTISWDMIQTKSGPFPIGGSYDVVWVKNTSDQVANVAIRIQVRWRETYPTY